jgi:4-methyl-5(b-hydroxyethyl)-thiazole monophosphate biosynthesis
MKKVLLLLANGYETYEASVFIDVIGWNLVDGDHSTKLYSCGTNRVVTSSFDQKTIVDYTLEEICANEFDALAIPGGFEEYDFYRDAYSQAFLELVREFKSRGKLIASICVGALILGKSGILKNVRATTYNMKPARQDTLRSFGANVQNLPVVFAENTITCWNPSTAMDVAFLLLEELTSPENAAHIKAIMGFPVKAEIGARD